jgi:hypothetical protein
VRKYRWFEKIAPPFDPHHQALGDFQFGGQRRHFERLRRPVYKPPRSEKYSLRPANANFLLSL